MWEGKLETFTRAVLSKSLSHAEPSRASFNLLTRQKLKCEVNGDK